MNVNLAIPPALHAGRFETGPDLSKAPTPDDASAKKQFQEILGELLFGQMLKSMRRTVDKPAYFHGGRAEEAFTQQLDQMLAQKMSQSAGDQVFGPMYELWSAGRR